MSSIFDPSLAAFQPDLSKFQPVEQPKLIVTPAEYAQEQAKAKSAPPPLPVMPSGKRDAGVAEMVEYLDRFADKYNDWDRISNEERFSRLKRKEREAILEQFEMCVADFSYAARNFFWITDKYGEDKLFRLWEAQWLVLQKYYELKHQGKAQKIMLLKARQLGASLLIEAMVAWRTMFFPNTNALVVSVDQDHASYLFSLMLHIYDMMPWWLKPERASRKEEQGLWFDRQDEELRRTRPGLNSRIYVQHSNQNSGVGQGRRISAGHVSEYTDFNQKRAEEIIEGDLLHAIHENPANFCFLESTGRGAGTYSHKLWKSCEALGDRAEWYPLFLPSFFESTRVMAPPKGWRIQRAEAAIRERIKEEWVRCDHCKKYLPAVFGGESRVGVTCAACGAGVLHPCVLSDEQLYWKETKRLNAESKGKEALKKHKQEMAVTAEDAWQLSGDCVFDERCQEMAAYTIRDPNKSVDVHRGFIDAHKRFHYMVGRKCVIQGCDADHRFDDLTFTVWELPKKDYAYSVGVDISEGIGQEYSVIAVNKIGRHGAPDEQVAVWRSNTVDPLELAYYCDAIGRMYNEALMCIEYNTGFRSTANTVRFQYMYPNFFRWKHLDSQNPMSQKLHWFTQYNTKPLLWQTMRKWIKAGLFIVRSPNTLAEMLTFQKEDEDDRSASHERGSFDDELMAVQIALYCAHEMEADERGVVPVPVKAEDDEPARYRCWCQSCHFGETPDESGKWPWGVANPESEWRCPQCGSIRIKAQLLEQADPRQMSSEQIDSLLNAHAPSQPGGPRSPFGNNLTVSHEPSADFY